MVKDDFYLKVKILRPGAKIDMPAKNGDAGLDVYSTETRYIGPNERYTMGLGFCMEFSEGYVCQVNQKSGLARDFGIDTMGNIIDVSYRGEVHVTILNTSNIKLFIEKGRKICQFVFLKYAVPEKIEYVDELSASERGENGYGSTGR